MSTRATPLLVGTRAFLGVIPSTSPRNISWNEDGQCLIVTRQRVAVATPYLTSALPKPAIPLNSSAGIGGGKGDDDGDDDAMDVDGGGGGGEGVRQLDRPKTGEVAFWFTTCDVDKSFVHDDIYGWLDVGDEMDGVLTEKERTIRSAIWSPSTLSEGGSSFVAVMCNSSQVSVYAPGSSPYTQEFVELADLTRQAVDLLPADAYEDDCMTISGALQVRATAMDWSAAVPVPSMIGVDGSLLAIANRAGGIDFWSYGADKNFARIAQQSVGKAWVSEMSWSQWSLVDSNSASASLALACTDGEILILPMTRSATPAGNWEISFAKLRKVLRPDKRAVNMIKWLNKDTLAWTKPGSVHFSSANWGGIKTVRLERVGNWAGANALDPCVGMHFIGPDTIVVVLASLTHHIIEGISTDPKLGPAIESLRLSLSARDVFLDRTKVRSKNRGFHANNDREYTAHTASYTGLGDGGDIAAWMAEPITLHNLENATEINRMIDFVIADLKTATPDHAALVQSIQSVLDHPPNLLYISPLAVLMPLLLRILTCSAAEAVAQDIIAIISSEPDLLQVATPSKIADKRRALMAMVFGQPGLDSLRLRLALAQWGQRTFPSLVDEFLSAGQVITQHIQAMLASTALRWASQPDVVGLALPEDAQYIRSLLAVAGSEGADPKLLALAADAAAGDLCPACSSEVPLTEAGVAVCANGHEWDRCSVTRLLIATPNYRLCTVCPAVSLLPDGDAKSLRQLALAAAVECLNCGGRWSRPA